jgi:hypothetical protein
VPFTKGFVSESELLDHFDRHNKLIGAHDEQHYLQLADTFLGGPKGPTTLECPERARDGCLTRFDYVTNEFGVLTPDSYILSYYIPEPKRHKQRTNTKYFQADCRSKE